MRIPWELVACFALGLTLMYLCGWLLLVPMRFLWRLAACGVLGGLMLWLVNQFGQFFGLRVAVNPVTALVTGFLGVPGAALIVALNCFFGA